MLLIKPAFKKLQRAKHIGLLLLTTGLLAACGGASSPGTATTAATSIANSGSETAATGSASTSTDTLANGSANAAADTPVAPTSVTSAPVFDLKGFKYCGDQSRYNTPTTLTFKTKTHVAFGLESENRFVYLFNQLKVDLTADFFGNDPIPSKYKKGYCKTVTADNNDAQVFGAAVAAITANLNGTLAMTPAELQLQNDRIKQTMYTVADSKENLAQAFAVLTAYEKKRGGAMFANAETKNGFPNDFYGLDGKELDRAVLSIQQSIFDTAYTPTNFAIYKSVLAGKKFNSSDWFPGKVKIPADPNKVYSAKINATMAEDLDKRTAFSRSFARRPTGYYLAAGDIAKITVPASMVKPGFVIQVGANVHDKYIKSTIMRPFRVTNRFPIVSEVTEIANPNGGGIYIDVPYLANAGSDVTVKIQNAVPAPFFSTTALNNVTLQQWQDIQRKNPAPWADFQSDKYMMTVPTSWIYNYTDPVVLMKDWDNRMDVVSDFVGVSKVRNNQILYLIADTSLYGDGFGIGYPTGNNGYNPGDKTDGNNNSWFLRPGRYFSDSEFHELGHAQLFSNFNGEGEAAINLLTVGVGYKLYGVSLDEGLGISMNNTPHIGRDMAAVNWMVTPNFRAGKPMDITHSTTDEVQYQQRGYAKYVEVAALFGWDKLEKFYARENLVYQGKAVAEGKTLDSDDSQILRMSIEAGVDLTPLIHFWGVQPKDAAALSSAIAAKGLKPSALIYDRLVKYKGTIPMSNAAFQAHAAAFVNKPVAQINNANGPDYGEGWYYAWLNKYDVAQGQAAQVAMDNILKRYFPAGRPAI